MTDIIAIALIALVFAASVCAAIRRRGKRYAGCSGCPGCTCCHGCGISEPPDDV